MTAYTLTTTLLSGFARLRLSARERFVPILFIALLMALAIGGLLLLHPQTQETLDDFSAMNGSVLLVILGFLAMMLIAARSLLVMIRSRRQAPGNYKSAPERALRDTENGFSGQIQEINTPDNAARVFEIRVADNTEERPGMNKPLENRSEAPLPEDIEQKQTDITDALTGLYNRRYFEQLMKHEVSRAVQNDETASILLIHIDRFKLIHDRLGEIGSNEIVRAVSRTIAGRISKTDVACRYSNDEFFVMCRRATIANSLLIADDLLQRLENSPVLSGGRDPKVTASIGIATIPGVHNIISAAEFFQCANEALQHSMRNGGRIALHYSMIGRKGRPASFH